MLASRQPLSTWEPDYWTRFAAYPLSLRCRGRQLIGDESFGEEAQESSDDRNRDAMGDARIGRPAFDTG